MNINDNSPFDFEAPKTDDTFTVSDEADFNFDLLQPVSDGETVDDRVDPPAQNRVMLCVCPKCAEKNEVDLAQMPEQMFAITCANCSQQMHVIRESCACRAKRKSLEINCANCGGLLDHHAHCHSCGKSFPDFFVTVNPDEARSKSRKEFFKRTWAAVTDLNVSFTPAFGSKTHAAVSGYSPTRTASVESRNVSRRYIVPVLIGLVAVV
ncbi:MAG: hypothetical protein PHI31_13365, partial [Desulfuromonadaceae bacterium]|nr:hypothetical protein [Desulfuromonadaceae bacterium]